MGIVLRNHKNQSSDKNIFGPKVKDDQLSLDWGISGIHPFRHWKDEDENE